MELLVPWQRKNESHSENTAAVSNAAGQQVWLFVPRIPAWLHAALALPREVFVALVWRQVSTAGDPEPQLAVFEGHKQVLHDNVGLRGASLFVPVNVGLPQ